MNFLYCRKLFNPLVKTSVAIIKRVGDKELPCFSPLVDLKNPLGCPLTKIECPLFEISLQTIFITPSANPNLLKTLVKKIQETLS